MQAVILAAGESSRFWPINKKHKSLFRIMGRPLICNLIDNLKKSGIKEIIIVQSPNRDIEEELKTCPVPPSPFGEGRGWRGVKYVIQKKPLGTGDAILCAEKLIKDQFFALNAERIDCCDYLKLILAKSKKEKDRAILLSVPTKTPWLFGVFKVKGDKILDIVERPEKGKEASNLRNAGVYLLPKEFLDYLKKVPTHPCSLILALLEYAKEKGLKTLKLKKETFYLKYPWDLFEINKYFLKNIKTKIKGKIEKNCHIKKPVVIEQGTIIKSGTYIEGPVYIGKNCQIGPNCFIRPLTSIDDNCVIGQAVEIKNSIISQGSHISHLNYVADSIIGENCNLGAGTVLANLRFDEKNIHSLVKGKLVDTQRQKLGAVFGKGVKTGVNASVMPGILVGSNSIIGPHSLVRENVQDNKIFYTKPQKIIKKR